jgi:hypothetical protein
VIEERLMVHISDPPTYNFMNHYFPVREAIPCLDRRIYVTMPSPWRAQVRRVGGRISPFVSHQALGAGLQEWSYKQRGVSAAPDEPFSPALAMEGDFFHVQLKEVLLGNTIYHSLRSWIRLGDMFAEFVVNKDAIFSRKVRQVTQRLTRGVESPWRRFQAVLRHVQREIALSEHRSKDFVDVIDSGEGSALQITGLARLMLEHAGLKAKFLMINPAENGPFDLTFISTDQFTYPALLVKVEQNHYIALPYIRDLPIGLIPPELQDRPALVVTRSGFDGWVQTHVLKPSHARIAEHYRVRIGQDGALEVEEEKRLHGLAAYIFPSAWPSCEAGSSSGSSRSC